MKVLQNKRILIISPESWEHNFVSKHHYAIHLGRKGNEVFFLNPPSRGNRIWKSSYPGLFIVDYIPKMRGLNTMHAMVSRFFVKRDIENIKSITQCSFDVVWTFDPYRFQWLHLFGAKVKIYFAADWHASEVLGHRTASYADIVLSPSHILLEKIRTDKQKYFLNHAVAEHFFEIPQPASLPGANSIKVGYVGNLNSRYLDLSLLSRVIEQNLQCDFVFIGDDRAVDNSLRQYDHVYFIGPKTNNLLPSILNACDILLLCYDTIKYNAQASNSHKIMEYLSSGRVVVSTRVHEYVGQSELIVMPNTNSDLPDLLRVVSSDLAHFNSELLRKKRVEYARVHTYSRQLAKLDQWIADIRLD